MPTTISSQGRNAIYSTRWSAQRYVTMRMIVATLALLGCQPGGDSIIAPKNSAESIPWFLNMNHKAVTMRTTDAVQLRVTPTTVDGRPVTGLPPVTWSTNDTALKVDETGRVTSSGPVRAGLVIARLSDPVAQVTLYDTSVVSTVDTAYRFSGYKLLLQNGPGDTVIPMAVANNFNAALLDATGQPITDGSGAVISPNAYYSSDAPFASFQVYTSPYPRATAYNIGTFTVRISSYLFGAEYRDSVTFRITYPRTVSLYIQRLVAGTGPSPSAMSQTDITIVQGGTVNFLNQNTTLAADIKFDNLAGVVGGDIPVVRTTSPGSPVTFPNVGKFTYRSSLGFTGTITVVAP